MASHSLKRGDSTRNNESFYYAFLFLAQVRACQLLERLSFEIMIFPLQRLNWLDATAPLNERSGLSGLILYLERKRINRVAVALFITAVTWQTTRASTSRVSLPESIVRWSCGKWAAVEMARLNVA